MTQTAVKAASQRQTQRRCILYARVSTEEQTEGPSLDEQLSACRRYAAERGMIRVAEFAEDFTGKTLERPKFQQVLLMLHNGSADALVVNYHDRLSRNYLDFLVLRDQLEHQGIELHFVDTGQARPGFEGLMTETIYALLAHGERERIIERTRMGKNGNARRGKAIMSFVPYGYEKDEDRCLVAVEEEARVIRNIFHWYAYGDGKGGPYTIVAIAKELNRRRVPPPSARNTKRQNRRWIDNTIYRILRNETYIGKLYWGKTRKNDKGKRVPQPRERWITINVPPLVEQKTFDICQQRFKRNRKLAKRNRKHDYLLVGHIRCGNCGRAMAGKAVIHDYGEYYYYKCTYSADKSDVSKPCTLERQTILCSNVDDAVLEWLMLLISDDDNLKKGLDELEREATAQLLPKRKRLQTVERMINTELNRIDRLVARVGAIDDDIVAGAMEREIRQAVDKKNALLEEKQFLEAELKQSYISPETREYILNFVRKIRTRMKDATYENIRTLLDILDVRVIIHIDGEKNSCDVSCVFPHGTFPLTCNQRDSIKSKEILILTKTLPIL